MIKSIYSRSLHNLPELLYSLIKTTWTRPKPITFYTVFSIGHLSTSATFRVPSLSSVNSVKGLRMMIIKTRLLVGG